MDKKFILFISIPAIVILVFFFSNYATVKSGSEILIEVIQPIDPKDLFRGNYVILNYELSRIDLSGIDVSERDSVYAILTKKEKFWTVDSLSAEKPSVAENQVCMKGEILNVFDNQATVQWGIDAFFIEEEKAKEIEKERREGNVASIVHVDSRCNAVLSGLVVANETIRTVG